MPVDDSMTPFSLFQFGLAVAGGVLAVGLVLLALAALWFALLGIGGRSAATGSGRAASR